MPEQAPADRRKTWLGLVLVGLFLLAHVVIPVVWGDIYPFTSAPMFRDAPQHYCNYRVLDPSGVVLSNQDWLTFRTYDGNPVGYGVGIQPPPVLERFGEIMDEATVRKHIEQQFKLAQNQRWDSVTIEQVVMGPVDGGRIGVQRTDRWQVNNPTKSSTHSVPSATSTP